jgi:2-polyprenyl-3-methyl-5-hydroxy-6-metoxy-1,4-benzoquinol methylase
MSDIAFDRGEIYHIVCQVCGGPISLVFKKAAEAGVFDIVRCRDCGFAFVNPTPSLQFITDFYADAGHGNYSLRSAQAVLAQEKDDPNSVVDAVRIVANLKTMAPGRNLLDVGCGYGLFSREALRRGFSVDAIEIANTERAIATQILPFAPIPVTFEDFRPQRKYDAAILSQILEHAREPNGWMRKLRELLNPDGVAAIALPNFGSMITDALKDRDPFVTPPTHLNYFSVKSLAELARRNGFTVLRIHSLTRILKRAFTRRFGRLLGRALHRGFCLVSPVFDVPRKGNMLNMYIRRSG